MSDTERKLKTSHKLFLRNSYVTRERLDAITTFNFRPDDILLVTYPKSGTFWMNYILKLLLMGPDTEESDLSAWNRGIETTLDTLEETFAYPSPRHFYTHLTADYLSRAVMEDKPRVIVLVRNPKDLLVSYYHYYHMATFFGDFSGTWDYFFEMFKKDELFAGNICEHVHGWWRLSDLENVKFVHYEEMQENLSEVVQSVAQFCGMDCSENILDYICKATEFNTMKNNPNANASRLSNMGLLDFTKGKFLRKGKVGDWRNYFTVEQSQIVDNLVKRYFGDSTFSYINT